MLGVQESDMKTHRSKLAKSMLEDLKFSGLQGKELDSPLSSNGVTLVSGTICNVCMLLYAYGLDSTIEKKIVLNAYLEFLLYFEFLKNNYTNLGWLSRR